MNFSNIKNCMLKSLQALILIKKNLNIFIYQFKVSINSLVGLYEDVFSAKSYRKMNANCEKFMNLFNTFHSRLGILPLLFLKLMYSQNEYVAK